MLKRLVHKLDNVFLHYGLMELMSILCDRILYILILQFYYRARFAYYGSNIRWGKHGSRRTIPRSVRISCPEKIILGDDVQIDEFVFLQCDQNGEGINIARGTRINSHVHILSGAKITIEEKVLIAPFSLISSNNHRFQADVPIMDQGMQPSGEILIGSGSWIGQNAKVLGGVNLGRNTVVGAGAIVTKGHYPNHSILIGSSAVVRGQSE